MIRIMKMAQGFKLGRVEKFGLIAGAVIGAVLGVIGSLEMAVGSLVGSVLVVINYVVIRLLVGALVGGGHSTKYAVFMTFAKLAVLVAIVLAAFIFAKINIYGFLIGVFAVVMVIIAEGLRGSSRDASL